MNYIIYICYKDGDVHGSPEDYTHGFFVESKYIEFATTPDPCYALKFNSIEAARSKQHSLAKYFEIVMILERID